MRSILSFVFFLLIGGLIMRSTGTGADAVESVPVLVKSDAQHGVTEPSCRCTHEFHGTTLQLSEPDPAIKRLFADIRRHAGETRDAILLCQAQTIPGNTIGFATRKFNSNLIVIEAAYVKTASIIRQVDLLAHELAHVVNRDYRRSVNHSYVMEWEADVFVGRVLFIMAYSLADSENIRSDNRHGTTTHPSQRSRKLAVREGWLAQQADYNALIMDEDAARIVDTFLLALSDRDFDRAFGCQVGEPWGPLTEFKSTRGFGGIIDVLVLTSPNIQVCSKSRGRHCTEIIVQAEYIAVDPWNDPCDVPGRVYNQQFHVRHVDGHWKITKTKLLLDPECRAIE